MARGRQVLSAAMLLILGVLLTTTSTAYGAHHLPLAASVHAFKVPASEGSTGVRFTVRSARRARCGLTVKAGKSRVPVSPGTVGRKGRVVWSWTVPAKAPAGRWRFTTNCSKGAAKRTGSKSLKVHPFGPNPYGSLAVQDTIAITDVHAEAARTKSRAARDQAHSATRFPPVTPLPGYPFGQCTWLAYKLFGDKNLGALGDAHSWAANAAAKGYRVSSIPAPDTIAVEQPGVNGADPTYGHVFYVLSVTPDGRFMNTVQDDVPVRGHLVADANGVEIDHAPTANVQFIYHKGDAPPSGATAPPPAPQSYAITGATGGVNVRNGPGTGNAVVGHLANGAQINIVCQIKSASVVNGSSVWDEVAPAQFVADYYTNTHNFNAYSPPLPECAGANARAFAINPGGGYGLVLDDFGVLHTAGSAADPGDQSGHTWYGWDIARDAASWNGRSGYVLDGWGGIHPFGGAPAVAASAYWSGWDIARAIELAPGKYNGYVLDGWGGIHPFGGAPAVAATGYWKGWDIARDLAVRPDGQSGYVLDGWGGIHPFGGAPNVSGGPYWKGWDIARSIALRPDGVSGWVLDGWGGIHPFGGAPAVSSPNYSPNMDIARRIQSDASGGGGWVQFANGQVFAFGDAPAVPSNWTAGNDSPYHDHVGGPH